ncbi:MULTISPECIES: hypothetical protein [unclassified Mesorhizobium]|uniref:hypothetical protein n=1 Tax=unclassified Mesorhizobium TaxID=325217 RepID=UPI0003CF7A12|nr:MULTISPECIES: hypothetical protein [unclassified Mesorhizobium]ESY49011.1 hypothetical protein X745_27940 [Mesorhizobium sp. LNJC374B00]ESY52751.1 hypothetical protein X744_28660 [Mesorhizobium sp. LNJC372A00]WJI81473.1 hypothetical protein NLY34_01550 [Mesorhizobium sp. C374B]WJI87992.1 hypothetical protein NLY42_03965 [Mesorhizobium sp. C372A]
MNLRFRPLFSLACLALLAVVMLPLLIATTALAEALPAYAAPIAGGDALAVLVATGVAMATLLGLGLAWLTVAIAARRTSARRHDAPAFYDIWRLPDDGRAAPD